MGGVDAEKVNQTRFQALENCVSGVSELRTELKIALNTAITEC